jgi:signal transduction histidine kinase
LGRSPTLRLLLGLLVTLLSVAGFSWYALAQLNGLKQLQADTMDRARRDSLQLLRVENDLSSLSLALEDMVLGQEPYGILAYRGQLTRIRTDLEDAIEREAALAGTRSPGQQMRLQAAMRQFWQTSDQVFHSAERGDEKAALQMASTQLLAQQTSLTAVTLGLLRRNNEAEEAAALKVGAIYEGVERNVYAFLLAALVTILATGLYMTYLNRVSFQRIESLSLMRRVLAAKLITVQEEVLRSVSRELHDEFGQILTAVGAMLARAERKGLPPDSPFRAELTEVREITQATLEKMRALSQMLHPAVIDDYGLVKGLEWYAGLFRKQTGIETCVSVEGEPIRITGQPAIHCFRIVQEALNNAAKHSKTKTAEVKARFQWDRHRLVVEVRDWGTGIVRDRKNQLPGLGLVAMQERAELLAGFLTVERDPAGGTVVSLDIPLPQPDNPEGEKYIPEEAARPQA